MLVVVLVVMLVEDENDIGVSSNVSNDSLVESNNSNCLIGLESN
jgi:hypothetical protein